MKNIRFLKHRAERKNTTEYAVFFEHEGMFARLDWELSDIAEVDPEHVGDLMLQQLELDMADTALVTDILRKNAEDVGKPSRLEMLLDSGWVEQEALEFKKKAVGRFGSE